MIEEGTGKRNEKKSVEYQMCTHGIVAGLWSGNMPLVENFIHTLTHD